MCEVCVCASCLLYASSYSSILILSSTFSLSHAPLHTLTLALIHTSSSSPSPSHPHTHTFTQILIECGTTDGKWLFPCHRWLCLDAGDGRIERELHPTVEEKEGRGGERRWRVHVWTSDIRGAGTDANVTLQVSQLGPVTLLQHTHPLKGHSGYSLTLYQLRSPSLPLEPTL